MTDFKQSSRLAMGYQGPASGKRYEMWREGICRSFCQLDAEPSESARIDCRGRFYVHAFTHSRYSNRIVGAVCTDV
jgi:hypothetical protein